MQDMLFLFYHNTTMLARSGLVVIIVGWLVQLNYSWKGRREIQPAFLVLQALGIFLLMISSFADGEFLLGFLNLLSCGGAIRVYVKTKK